MTDTELLEFLNEVKNKSEDVQAMISTIKPVLSAVDEFVYHHIRHVPFSEPSVKTHFEQMGEELQGLLAATNHLYFELEDMHNNLTYVVCQKFFEIYKKQRNDCKAEEQV